MAFTGYIRRHHLEVRMTDFHSVHTSSNLVGATNININKLIKPTIMNDKNLTKKTKKELIELFNEIKEQNNKLKATLIIKQGLIDVLIENNNLKNTVISKREKLIDLKDKDIDILNNKLNKIITYSIILDVCIIVGALLMVLFI